jgi:hemerythrin
MGSSPVGEMDERRRRMPLHWSPAHSVGVPFIDHQHQQLFARVDALLRAAVDDEPHDVLVELFVFLEEYIHEHFTAEEELMDRAQYPAAETHCEAHARFVDDIAALKSALVLKGESDDLLVRTLERLTDWLLHHVGRSDRELGAFLRTRDLGAREA